jgi:hypothetical protein
MLILRGLGVGVCRADDVAERVVDSGGHTV